jgi:hypothetical protein
MDDFFTHWEASDSNPFLSIQGGKNKQQNIFKRKSYSRENQAHYGSF